MNTHNTNFTVGFIGGGNMASSIIGGLIPDIMQSQSIHVFDPNTEQLEKLSKAQGTFKKVWIPKSQIKEIINTGE